MVFMSFGNRDKGKGGVSRTSMIYGAIKRFIGILKKLLCYF